MIFWWEGGIRVASSCSREGNLQRACAARGGRNRKVLDVPDLSETICTQVIFAV